MNARSRKQPGATPCVMSRHNVDREAVLAEMKATHLSRIQSLGAVPWLSQQVSYINSEAKRISGIEKQLDEKFADLVFHLKLREDVSGKIAETLDPEATPSKSHLTFDLIKTKATTQERNYLISLINGVEFAKLTLADLWALMDEIMTENTRDFEGIAFGDDMIRGEEFEDEEDAPGAMYSSPSDMANELRKEVDELRIMKSAISQ